jgi:hypothetical protein
VCALGPVLQVSHQPGRSRDTCQVLHITPAHASLTQPTYNSLYKPAGLFEHSLFWITRILDQHAYLWCCFTWILFNSPWIIIDLTGKIKL